MGDERDVGAAVAMSAHGAGTDAADAVGSRVDVLVVDTGGALGEALARLLARHNLTAERGHVDTLPAHVSRHCPIAVLVVVGTDDPRFTKSVRWLRRHVPDVRIVVVGVGGHRADSEEDLLHVTLDDRPRDLIAVVSGIAAPESSPRWRPAAPTPRHGALGELTTRELDVLRLIMAGRSSPAMAERLGISPHTVRTHVQNIMGKLGVRTRLQAATVAHRAGLHPSRQEEATAARGRRSVTVGVRR